MCGIHGVLAPRGDLSAALEEMGARLAHRGPDGAGIERTPRALLGHTRLRIIDLSEAASQPLWDAGRRACIVFNGEIYNYREIRDECRRAGLELRSASDTEAIVGLYLLEGERAFARLDGIFAFCILDARSGEAFLVRDPMGVKPLYWAPRPEGLVFASELGALVGSGLVPPDVDPAALQAYLQLDFVPGPGSIVRGVSKLREGHLLHFDASGKWSIRRYAPPPPPVADGPGSFERDVAEFDRLIHRTVERQLVADVPVGVFLSGGLDSSIVARTAAEVSPSRIATFSIGFEDPSFDESRWSSLVAASIGSDHHVEVLGPRALLDLIPSVAEVLSEPLADGSIFPTILLSRFTRRHVTVALSGDGADELFAGYPTYRAAGLALWLSRLPRPVRRALATAADEVLPVSHGNFSLDFKLRKFLAGLDPDPVLRNARWLGTFEPEELPLLLQDHDGTLQPAFERLLHEPSAESPGVSGLESLLRTDQRFYLQDQVLVKVDRASMSCALEVRVPYLAPEIVAFARALPPDRKLRGAQGKVLLRAYAANRLPPEIVGRRKKGFGAPLARWFRGELRDLLEDVLSRASLERHGIFKPAFVSRLLRDHATGRRDHRKRLFNLLMFQLWWNAFAEDQRRAAALARS
jgi:asparagine synthase (glutamine-hydrolysing)